jgi:hypothetical protein
MLTPPRHTTRPTGRIRPKADPPRPPQPDRFWATVAIIAIIVATAGWTTVALTAFRGPSSATAALPTDDLSAVVDESLEPGVETESHEAVDLEALLPTEHDGAILTAESWTGETIFGDDDWSAVFLAVLEEHGKVAADFAVAQAWDSAEVLDLAVGGFRIDGVEPTAMLEAMKAAWLASDGTFVTTEMTLAGQQVIKGVYEDESVTYYWYVANGIVYDIETSDEAMAAAVIAGITQGSTTLPDPSQATEPSSPAASPST